MSDPERRLPTSVIHLIVWPSLALGLAATFRPARLAAALGLDPARVKTPIRWAGRRELVVLAAFLARAVRPSLWMFIGQDAFDLTVGSLALATNNDVAERSPHILTRITYLDHLRSRAAPAHPPRKLINSTAPQDASERPTPSSTSLGTRHTLDGVRHGTGWGDDRGGLGRDRRLRRMIMVAPGS